MARMKKARWLFATSTNNLRMILAQGLMISPPGFGKYYQDSLNDYDGYLPLFNHQVPAESLAKAISEVDHLTPCLLEFDLAGVSGQVTAIIKGVRNEILLESITENIVADIEQIFIPLPLPLGCISKVIFKNNEDIEVFKNDAGIRSNVVLNKLKLQSTKVDSRLFEASNMESSLELNDTEVDKIYELPPIKADYPMIYAYGGILALLFYSAKNGVLSHRLFDDISQQKIAETNDSKEQLIPNFVHQYFHGGIDESQSGNKILKGIADACISHRGQNDFKNTVIGFLRNSSWDKESEKRSGQLAEKLQGYVSNSSASVSEWFDSAKSDIEKVLLMLFTRDDSDSFIDYSNPKIHFSERENLFFVLFFGIRDGFIKLPEFLRKYNGLQTYTSFKMADYAHKKMASNISFKEIKPPLSVWQFVDKKLSKSVVKILKLESCVQTIMPKADFQNIKGVNIYTGYFEPTYKVLNKNYFNIVSTRKISDADYNKLK